MRSNVKQSALLHLISLAAVLLLLLVPAHSARADIAPPPPPAAGNVQPNAGETKVRMMAETVLLDVAAVTGTQAPYAKVSASFTMRNLGEAEERMQVRFPLNLQYPHYQGDYDECVYPEGGFPEISSFTAKVDGKSARVTTDYERITDWTGENTKDVACWATFPVTFPAQQDVFIEVSYRSEGYFGWTTTGLVEFPYVLITGAGWAGTIGSADITLRAPHELNTLNVMGYEPEGAVVSGREIRWHFEEIEPNYNISATLVNPSVWARVLKERQNVEKTPLDGEAWGRLAKAYKESIIMPRGYRWDAGAAEVYRLSKEAYAKSVTLLPKDADWHYGYGELLWWNTYFASFGSNEELRNDLVLALDQLRLALEINPGHARSRAALEEFGGWYAYSGPIVDLSADPPIFLALTTTPTVIPTRPPIPTQTPLPSPTVPATKTVPPTPNPTPTVTAAVTVEAPATAAQVVEPTVPPTSAPAGKNTGRGACAAGLLPVAALVLVSLKKRIAL